MAFYCFIRVRQIYSTGLASVYQFLRGRLVRPSPAQCVLNDRKTGHVWPWLQTRSVSQRAFISLLTSLPFTPSSIKQVTAYILPISLLLWERLLKALNKDCWLYVNGRTTCSIASSCCLCLSGRRGLFCTSVGRQMCLSVFVSCFVTKRWDAICVIRAWVCVPAGECDQTSYFDTWNTHHNPVQTFMHESGWGWKVRKERQRKWEERQGGENPCKHTHTHTHKSVVTRSWDEGLCNKVGFWLKCMPINSAVMVP